MKTLILKFSLILCLVFLGFNSAQAATTLSAASTTGLAGTNLTTSQNNIAIMGFTVTTTNNTTFKTFTFTANTTNGAFISPNFTGFQLYVNTSNNAGNRTFLNANTTLVNGTVITPTTLNGVTTFTITFTTGNNQVINNDVWAYFIVADYTQPPTDASTFQLSLTNVITTGNATTNGNANTTGPVYTLTPPPAVTVTATSLSTTTNPTQPNAGLTANPIAATGNTKAIYGLKLAPSATGVTKNITAINFTTVGAPAQTNDYFIANAYLYASANPTYTAGGSPIATITGVTATNTLNFTGLNIPVTAGGAALYYFVVIDYTTPVAQAETFQLSFASTTGVTSTGTPAGYSYNFPAVTLAATSLNTATAPTAPTAGLGLETNPISTTGSKAIYGLKLTPSAAGTGPTRNITSINFTTAAVPAQTNDYFIANAYLYASASPTYTTGGSPIATITGVGATNTLNFTGLNIPVAAGGAALYYFVVVDYNTPVAQTETLQLSFASTAGVTSTGAPVAGYNYTFSAVTLAATSLNTAVAPTAPTAGLGLETNPIATTGSKAIYGLKLTPSAAGPTKNITSINFTTAASPAQTNDYFMANAYLYASASPTYTTGGSPIATITGVGATNTLNFTGLNIPVTGGAAPLYYFVVIDYNTAVAQTETLQLSFASTTGVTSTGAPVAGYNYTFSAVSLTAASLNTAIAPAAPTAGLGLETNPIATTGSKAIYGLKLTPSAAGPTRNITSINFTTAALPAQTNDYFMANAYLYASASPTYTTGGSPIATITGVGATNTLNFTGLNIPVTGGGAPLYYFVVIDYNTAVPQAETLQLTFASTTGVASTPTSAGYNYTFSAVSLTAASLNTAIAPAAPTAGLGLETNPIATTGSKAIYGLKLTPSAAGPTRNITSINFTTAALPAQTNDYFMANAYLYASASPTYTTGGSPIATITGVGATNTLNFTGLNIPVTGGDGPLYYFVVIDYNTAVPQAETLQLTFASTTGITSTPTSAGYKYTFSALTITATSLGTAGNNGLTTNPIVVPQTNVPIYELQLGSTGTGPAQTINSLTFKQSNAQNNNVFYGNMYLYSSTSSTFMGVGASQTSSVPLATTATAGNSANLTFSGLNITVPNGTPIYYFVLVDYAGYSGTGASAQCELDFVSATGVTVAAGAGNKGILYTYAKPTLAVSGNNAAAYTGNLDHDVSNTVLFSFLATPTGPVSVTGFTITGTGTNMTNLSTYFPNSSLTLYSSTQATFPGIALATLVKTINPTPTNTSIGITGLTQSISSPLYYYLVANYTDKIVDATTAGLQFQLTAVATASTVTGLSVSGGTYTLSSPVTLDNPPFTNIAVNPLSTNASASGVPILGFSVTTTQAESFTKFVLTTATGTTISPYFTGTPTLFVNTTASGSGGIAVPTGAYTVTSTGITINLTTPQTFAGAGTQYYYLSFPTYTAPATSTTFELDASSVSTSTLTYTNGAPAQGLLYALGPPVYDWNGSTATAGVYNWTNPANWSIGGSVSTTYPGQSGNTDAVRFGTNYTYPATHQPLLTTSVTVKSTLFGYNGGNGVTVTVNGAAVTLTSGFITQNNYPNADQFTILTGTGNIVCTGDFNIGDGTAPTAGSKNVTSITSTISHITINGNLNFKAIGTGTGSQSNNYPYFGLDKNQLTLIGQMIFTSTANPYSYGNGRGGNEYYQNIARFNMDTNGANPTTLELQNAAAISTPIDQYYVDFTDLGGSSTVIYDDPNANETQTIYTTATTGLGVNNYNYINLKLSGASTKRFLGNSCTIGGDLTSDGPGSVDMFTNSPTITIGDDWTNTTNVSQGGATVTVGDDMTNNANTITCGSGTLEVDGQFTNAAGSFLCGTGKVIYKGGYLNSATFTPGLSPGMVYFTNTQTLKDNSTGGTMFNDVTCNSGTATMSSGNFSLSNIGRLYVTTNNKLAITSPAASFTLISNQNSTATVEALSGTSTITGTVNVQRYVTGGAPYRGYRLFSSPVNITGLTNNQNSTTEGFVDPTYLNGGMLTGGPGTGFRTTNANPLSYLYDDTRASSAYHFYSGKNVGIYSIAGAPNYTVTVYNTDGSVRPTPVKVPVGNAFLVYYAGTTALSNPAPESTVVTATGTLNQGTVNIWIFNPAGTVTRNLTPTNANSTLGLNQIGNPYASTIQLYTFYNDNSSSILPTVYLLDPTTGISGTYLGYNASTRTTSSTNRASNYVVSGQGFWVSAKTATSTIAFKETEKVDYPAITSATVSTGSGASASGGTLLMDIPPTASNNDITAGSFAQNTAAVAPATDPVAALVGLHLQLSKDSATSIAYTQTGIYFRSDWTDTFNANDDAIDRDGATPKVFLSSYSSDAQRLCINQLAGYTKGKRIKLYAGATTSGLYYISLADIANIDTINYNVYLVDHKMNDSLDMVKYKAYAFNIATADTSTYGANRFTLAVERKALPPYVLITFSGQKVSNGVQLFWKTLNEGTYTTFALQKLGGSNTYSSIYTTQGTGVGIYADVDLHPSNGANTYRLQQTDINGVVTYSQPVTVNYSATATNGSLTIYPNPSKTIINISLNTKNTGSNNYIADIYNTAGSVVAHKIVSADTWTQDISAYKLGVYIIEIKTDSGNLVGQSKFVKIN